MTNPAHPPDPAGVFASDTHRRVLAHLSHPDDEAISVEDLLREVQIDPETFLWEAEPLAEVLADLATEGYAKSKGDLWRQSKEGHAKLNGPVLTHRIEVDGRVEAVEPPPMEGARLEEAERKNAEELQANEEAEKEARLARVEQLKEELASAEEEAAA